jgi:hypothetical protein
MERLQQPHNGSLQQHLLVPMLLLLLLLLLRAPPGLHCPTCQQRKPKPKALLQQGAPWYKQSYCRFGGS